jgi:threonine/homoserine/homoserine lactone efflux protein
MPINDAQWAWFIFYTGGALLAWLWFIVVAAELALTFVRAWLVRRDILRIMQKKKDGML